VPGDGPVRYRACRVHGRNLVRRRSPVIEFEQPEQPGRAELYGDDEQGGYELADDADAAGARRGHVRRAHRASRAHLHGAVRPSPARAEPHDSDSWLPLPDVDTLPDLEGLIARSTGARDVRSAPPSEDAPPPPPPSPARARPHDPSTWFPLPVPDELPSIDAMLTAAPWEAKDGPGRARPHDAAAWLPLPHVDSFPDVATTTTERRRTDRDGRARQNTLTRLRAPRLLAVAFLVVGTLVPAGFGLDRLIAGGTSVEMRVDGRRTSFDTGLTTVGAVIRDQGVELDPFDRVVPPRTTPVRDGMTITVSRAFPIMLDLDGHVEVVHTTYASPADFVRLDLSTPNALVVRDAPKRLRAQSTITLRTVHPGRLVVDEAQVDYEVPALDVGELLANYSVELGPEDHVVDRAGAPVSRDARLVDHEQYSVIRVGREIVATVEPYSAPDERRPDTTMAAGEVRIEHGTTGLMNVSNEILRRNGEEVQRKTVSRVPLVVAKPNIVYYGTKADPMWDRIAYCETGGNWGMQGPLYSGGLGFYNGTWDTFGGRDFAPNAGLATREEQIVVAERIRAGVGIGGWGCARIMGYLH
jgi:uncharacterized protein YabE (DUF348 family)